MLNPLDQAWIEEKEIMDRFVFGKLSHDEGTRFDNLLQSDENLRIELSAHLVAIAAIRENGRRQMKARIQELTKTKSFSIGIYYRVAAAIVAAAGLSFMLYTLNRTPVEPIAMEDRLPVVDTVKSIGDKNVAKSDPIQDKNEIRRTTKVSEKKMIASIPPGKRDVRHAMTKPNELTLPLKSANASKEIRLLFKNPIDLTAVRIKETQSVQDGQLQWFYTHYANDVVNVYLDNAQYYEAFVQSELKEAGGIVSIITAQGTFQWDGTSKEKFVKATRLK